MYPADDKRVGGYYYPIYKGWVTTTTPIFETASAAICFQISQYKRDLLQHNTVRTTVWFDVVGSIDPSDFDQIIPHLFHSTSVIAQAYFDEVKFFKAKVPSYIKSRLVKISSQTLSFCSATFKDNTDYQVSSTSIFKPGSFCVIEHNVRSMSYCFDSTRISQKRDNSNMIVTVASSKNIVLSPNIRSMKYIIEKLVKASIGYSGKNVVVSLGAGSGITEIASNTLVLCLDIDKRAIHTGINQVKGSVGVNRTIFAVMDYSENVEELLREVNISLPNKSIRVILQHPNPSQDDHNRLNLKLLFYALRMSLMKGIVHDVTFVYDLAFNRNTWNRTTLLDLLMPNNELTHYDLTDHRLVSLKGCDEMDHPLFGKTERYGWAAMRNSDEWCFTVGGYSLVGKDKTTGSPSPNKKTYGISTEVVSTEVNEEQPSKGDSPIVVTPDGIPTKLNEEQP